MTNPVPPVKRHAERLDAAMRLRAWLWDNSSDAAALRVTACGRKRVAEMVQVRANGEASSLGGLSTCSSTWACPCCSAKIAAQRSREVQDACRQWQARGGSVLLVTLTLRHDARHALGSTWDAIGKGWAAVRNGNGWKADSRDFRISGYVRVIEITHGRNGWHPHVHVLLFVEGKPTVDDAEALRARIFGRWSRRLARKDLGYRTAEFGADGKAVAVDVRIASAHDLDYVAEYVSKFGYVPKGTADGSTSSWDVAREVARGDLKKGRKTSRTPWEILEAAADGDRRSKRLWHEYEAASKGRRQYAWAEGFRESLDLESVLSDAEAAEIEDAQHETRALLPKASWSVLVADLRRNRHRPGAPLMVQMLAAAAALGAVEFHGWLDAVGIPYVLPSAGDGDAMPVYSPAVARRLPETLVGAPFEHRSVNERDQSRREARLSVSGPDSGRGFYDDSDQWDRLGCGHTVWECGPDCAGFGGVTLTA